MGNKADFTVSGIDGILDKLEQTQNGIDNIIYEVMVETMQEAGQELINSYNAIPKKHPTGKTVKSYKESFKNVDGVISGKVGFDTKHGGMPAVFWNYGSPTTEPTFFIDKVRQELRETLPDKQRAAIIKKLEE